MAWIESHQSLRNHPKLARLARQLGIPKPQAVGHLMYLWWAAVDYAPDGDLSALEVEEIAEMADWQGDAQAFYAALVKAEFIDVDPCRIHDWEQYGGRLLTKREANAERQRKHRERVTNTPPEPAESVSNASVTRDVRVSHGTTYITDNTDITDKTPDDARAHAKNGATPVSSAGVLDDFNSFFAAYPISGRGTKQKAQTAYLERRRQNVAHEDIVAGLERWKTCDRWQRGFVLTCADWLTDGKFFELPPPEPKAKRTATVQHGAPAPYAPKGPWQ